MTIYRSLGDMLGEVASGTLEALAGAPDLRIRRIAVILPVEVRLHRARNQMKILGDLPRSVTRTAFDLQPNRLEVVWEMREPT